MRALFLLLILATAGPGLGQDPRFDIRAGRDDVSASAVSATARDVTAALDTLVSQFRGFPVRRFEVVVHRSRDSVPEGVRRHVHHGTAGVALLGRQQVHLILDAVRIHPPHDLATVVVHECVHIVLHQYAGDAGPYVPRWFHEGLAQALSGETYLGASEEDLVFFARTRGVPGFSTLRDRFPRGEFALRIAYAQSFSFVSFLLRETGLPILLEIAGQCGPDQTFAQAYRARTGVSLATVEHDWIEYVKTGSGAAFRVLLASCFALTMVAVLPLLVLAGVRRWNRDHKSHVHLQSLAADADSAAPQPPASRTHEDGA